MHIVLCGSCHGRGFTEREEGTNYGTHQVKSACVSCTGRGCDPIPPDLLSGCPSCGSGIFIREIVPYGACRFCDAKLAVLLPKCFLEVWKSYTHTFFHDNSVGAGFSIQLSELQDRIPGPRVIRAEERSRIFYPGDARSYSKVTSHTRHHGSVTVEIGRLGNTDGKIVETVLSAAEIVVTQTLARR